jgi:branched-chain amino acid transport system substrate-binding protein
MAVRGTERFLLRAPATTKSRPAQHHAVHRSGFPRHHWQDSRDPLDKINAEGGINGRKITFYHMTMHTTPPKPSSARKLVGRIVSFRFAGLGTAPEAAVQPYLNSKKVPQLFVASGASMWDQPRQFPWTMGWQPSYQTEAHIYAQYLL